MGTHFTYRLQYFLLLLLLLLYATSQQQKFMCIFSHYFEYILQFFFVLRNSPVFSKLCRFSRVEYNTYKKYECRCKSHIFEEWEHNERKWNCIVCSRPMLYLYIILQAHKKREMFYANLISHLGWSGTFRLLFFKHTALFFFLFFWER
jgi:hypothetical protein